MTENIFTSEMYEKSKQIGCCSRCCLRFCGLFSLDIYEGPMNHDNVNEKKICIACLGILEDQFVEKCIEKVISEVKNSECDCETFCLSISVPAAVMIRDRAVLIHLKNNVFSPIQNIKTVCKHLLASKIESSLNKNLENPRIDMDFVMDIEVELTYSEDDDECLGMIDSSISNKKRNKNFKLGRKKIEDIISSTSDSDFLKFCSIPPIAPQNPTSIGLVECTQRSIFVGGRYTKMSRKISQTPWLINGVNKNVQSVQDSICNILKDQTKCKEIKFGSSGREDVDVRMQLEGRPFSLELVNSKTAQSLSKQLQKLREKINQSSEHVKIVSDLKILTKEDLQKLKEGEICKSKEYRALCVFQNSSPKNDIIHRINTLGKLKIVQKTPVRVLHRRPFKLRERYIHAVRARNPTIRELETYSKLTKYDKESVDFLILDVKTEAGTYVKEFVHGDFGRTVPNLSQILSLEIDIIALDVMKINLDWP